MTTLPSTYIQIHIFRESCLPLFTIHNAQSAHNHPVVLLMANNVENSGSDHHDLLLQIFVRCIKIGKVGIDDLEPKRECKQRCKISSQNENFRIKRVFFQQR